MPSRRFFGIVRDIPGGYCRFSYLSLLPEEEAADLRTWEMQMWHVLPHFDVVRIKFAASPRQVVHSILGVNICWMNKMLLKLSNAKSSTCEPSAVLGQQRLTHLFSARQRR
jgi:hypothetical protein